MAIKASMMMKPTNVEFRAIMNRRSGAPKGAMLSRILKSGKPGKPTFYKFLNHETIAQELIENLEKMNPGTHWVEA